MHKKFSVVPIDVFQTFQFDAGILMHDFDIELLTEYWDKFQKNIICATTGGISISCTPIYIDQGEDIDFCPSLKEFQVLKGWDCRMSFTCLNMSIDMFKDSIGAADMSGAEFVHTSDTTVDPNKTYYWYSRAEGETDYSYHVVQNPDEGMLLLYYERIPDWRLAPRSSLIDTDFKDIWWVGDRCDDDAGMVAVCLKNALSMNGFNLQTSKSSNGKLTIELKGFASIEDYSTPPFMCYTKKTWVDPEWMTEGD